MKTLTAAALALAALDAAAAEPDLQFSRAGSRPVVEAAVQYFSGQASSRNAVHPLGQIARPPGQ